VHSSLSDISELRQAEAEGSRIGLSRQPGRSRADEIYTLDTDELQLDEFNAPRLNVD